MDERKIVDALKREHPGAVRITKNEFCNGWDVFYDDGIVEETHTYKVTNGRAYLIGIITADV